MKKQWLAPLSLLLLGVSPPVAEIPPFEIHQIVPALRTNRDAPLIIQMNGTEWLTQRVIPAAVDRPPLTSSDVTKLKAGTYFPSPPTQTTAEQLVAYETTLTTQTLKLLGTLGATETVFAKPDTPASFITLKDFALPKELCNRHVLFQIDNLKLSFPLSQTAKDAGLGYTLASELVNDPSLPGASVSLVRTEDLPTGANASFSGPADAISLTLLRLITAAPHLYTANVPNVVKNSLATSHFHFAVGLRVSSPSTHCFFDVCHNEAVFSMASCDFSKLAFDSAGHFVTSFLESCTHVQSKCDKRRLDLPAIAVRQDLTLDGLGGHFDYRFLHEGRAKVADELIQMMGDGYPASEKEKDTKNPNRLTLAQIDRLELRLSSINVTGGNAVVDALNGIAPSLASAFGLLNCDNHGQIADTPLKKCLASLFNNSFRLYSPTESLGGADAILVPTRKSVTELFGAIVKVVNARVPMPPLLAAPFGFSFYEQGILPDSRFRMSADWAVRPPKADPKKPAPACNAELAFPAIRGPMSEFAKEDDFQVVIPTALVEQAIYSMFKEKPVCSWNDKLGGFAPSGEPRVVAASGDTLGVSIPLKLGLLNPSTAKVEITSAALTLALRRTFDTNGGLVLSPNARDSFVFSEEEIATKPSFQQPFFRGLNTAFKTALCVTPPLKIPNLAPKGTGSIQFAFGSFKLAPDTTAAANPAGIIQSLKVIRTPASAPAPSPSPSPAPHCP